MEGNSEVLSCFRVFIVVKVVSTLEIAEYNFETRWQGFEREFFSQSRKILLKLVKSGLTKLVIIEFEPKSDDSYVHEELSIDSAIVSRFL